MRAVTAVSLLALGCTACTESRPDVRTSADGTVTVLTIPEPSPDDPTTRAALDWAGSRGDQPQVAVAIGLGAALTLVGRGTGTADPELAVLVADRPSPELDAGLERGDFVDAVRVPDPADAAAEVTVLLAHRIAVPGELFLPGAAGPGNTTLELLREAHAPTLDAPRREGRPLILGVVWTDERSSDTGRAAFRSRCAAAGGAIRLVERQTEDPAGAMVDLVALGVDALVVDGGQPARLGPAIRAARAVGVPVVSIAPDHPTGLADCVVRIDAPRIGQQLAEKIHRLLGERGGLVISVTGPDVPAGLGRVHPGMLEALGIPPGRDAAR